MSIKTLSFLIGVGVGILIAPRKGSETRKKITKSVNNLSDYIDGMIEIGRGEADDLAEAEIESVEKEESEVDEVYVA
jgi:gas vesicle protein